MRVLIYVVLLSLLLGIGGGLTGCKSQSRGPDEVDKPYVGKP